jgi:hypothetical protein
MVGVSGGLWSCRFFEVEPVFDPDTSATLTHGGWRFLPGAAMTEPHLALVDLSTQDLEHALAHAEQPTRYYPICANGSPIRPEDYDRAIQARMYNARQLVHSMIRHLSRLKYPQVSLTAIYKILDEVELLEMAKAGALSTVTRAM